MSHVSSPPTWPIPRKGEGLGGGLGGRSPRWRSLRHHTRGGAAFRHGPGQHSRGREATCLAPGPMQMVLPGNPGRHPRASPIANPQPLPDDCGLKRKSKKLPAGQYSGGGRRCRYGEGCLRGEQCAIGPGRRSRDWGQVRGAHIAEGLKVLGRIRTEPNQQDKSSIFVH